MGVGHLNIGQGLGDAQVFGHNPAVAQFANQLAQRKAKQDADNKYLAEQLATVKPDGLRNDADKGVFYDKYAKIKQQALDAEAEKDPRKRVMAMADVRESLAGLSAYADESKKQAAKENSFAQAYMQNPTAWSDESIAKHRASTQMAVSDPNVVKDYTTLARQPDLVKLDTRLKKVRDDLLDGIKGQDVITGRQKVGNKMVNQIQTKYTADPEDVNHAYLNEFDVNPDFQHHLVSQYGHAIPPGLPQAAQKAALVHQYIKDTYGDELSTYGKVKDNADFRPRVSTNIYVGGQPSAQAIPTENNEGKQIGTFSSPNYLPMNHSGLNMAGLPSINMQTMQPEKPLKSSSKYNLVGLTSAPVINKDLDRTDGNGKKTTIPKGSLAQGNYAKEHPEDVTWNDMAHVQEDYPADDEHPKPYTVDHLVDQSLLPRSVTGTKAWKGETSNYKSFGGKSDPNKVYKASTGQSYNHAQLLKLGYTEQQIQQAIQLGNLK